MNWDAIGAVGEVGGAIAVVAVAISRRNHPLEFHRCRARGEIFDGRNRRRAPSGAREAQGRE
jgi:hypothetical protein